MSHIDTSRRPARSVAGRWHDMTNTWSRWSDPLDRLEDLMGILDDGHALSLDDAEEMVVKTTKLKTENLYVSTNVRR